MKNALAKENDRPIEDYYFIDLESVEAKNWMRENYEYNYLIGDGSPFCAVEDGWLIRKSELKNIHDKCPIELFGTIFEIVTNDDLKLFKEFLMLFEDGDISDEDLVVVYEGDIRNALDK
jgi:hypothetical protein